MEKQKKTETTTTQQENQSHVGWTNEQWAKYLNVSKRKVSKIRKVISDNFSVGIEKNPNTDLYYISFYQYEITPSGFKRPLLQQTSKQEFPSVENAITFANETLIPKLELNDFAATVYGVPAKAIRMLAIQKER